MKQECCTLALALFTAALAMVGYLLLGPGPQIDTGILAIATLCELLGYGVMLAGEVVDADA